MPKTKPFDNYSDEYDRWFDENEKAYQSEVLAMKELIPESFEKGVEIGVGTGRFATRLGIQEGVEPSNAMGEVARDRGLNVIKGKAEDLPLESESYDLAVMVTTICFVDDLEQSFQEAHRILEDGGQLVLGFVPGDSEIGQFYKKNEADDRFYSIANFFTAEEVFAAMESAGFNSLESVQTLTRGLEKANEGVEKPGEGYGDGSFVVVRGIKRG
jgi:SAM-dependent methyltransferase